jgi:hypothetical protein
MFAHEETASEYPARQNYETYRKGMDRQIRRRRIIGMDEVEQGGRSGGAGQSANDRREIRPQRTTPPQHDDEEYRERYRQAENEKQAAL